MSTFLTPKISREVALIQAKAVRSAAQWDLFLRLADRTKLTAMDAALAEMEVLIRELRSDLALEDTFTAEAEETQEVTS